MFVMVGLFTACRSNMLFTLYTRTHTVAIGPLQETVMNKHEDAL